MRKIDGLQVINASVPLRLDVTPTDIKNGRPKNPNACAIALSAMRQKGVTAAKVHLSCLYLLKRKAKHWLRWKVPEYATREIVAFDRGGHFVPCEIDLQLMPVIKRKAKPNGHAKRFRNSQPRRRHVTADVRESAYANEPRQS